MDSLSDLHIIILLIIGALLLAGIIFYFNPKNRILRALKKVRRKSINSVREREYVKIVGKAKSVDIPLIAPLSKRPCVYYDVQVSSSDGENSYIKIHDVQFQDFYIEEGTDSALVKLHSVRNKEQLIYLVTDHNMRSGSFNKANDNMERFLEEHGESSKGFLGFSKSLRYTERIIEIDEEIAVMGIGKWITVDQPKDGYSSSRTLALSGTKEQQLMITDEPKAMKRVKRKL